MDLFKQTHEIKMKKVNKNFNHDYNGSYKFSNYGIFDDKTKSINMNISSSSHKRAIVLNQFSNVTIIHFP